VCGLRRGSAGAGASEVHERAEVGYGWRFGPLGEFADEVEREWKERGIEPRYA